MIDFQSADNALDGRVKPISKIANPRPCYSPSPGGDLSRLGNGERNLAKPKVASRAGQRRGEGELYSDSVERFRCIGRAAIPEGQPKIAQRFNAGLSRLWNLKSRRDGRILCRKGLLSPVKQFWNKNLFLDSSMGCCFPLLFYLVAGASRFLPNEPILRIHNPLFINGI